MHHAGKASNVFLTLHQREHRESMEKSSGKDFSSKDCLKSHMVRHTDGFPCPQCGKKFYWKLTLQWHLDKHTGQHLYYCDTCGKGWPNARLLKLHNIQDTEERPFKCGDCGVCYKRESNLITHHRDTYMGLQPFLCKVCNKAFSIISLLKEHMRVHTGERPFMCPRCGKKFSKKLTSRNTPKKACR